MKSFDERDAFFLTESERYLIGGAAFSEWCVFISKSIYTAFVNAADLPTIITVSTCIEAYLRSELQAESGVNFASLINEYCCAGSEMAKDLHDFRHYRNKWAHCGSSSDDIVFDHENELDDDLESWSFKSVTLLFEVLYSNQFI